MTCSKEHEALIHNTTRHQQFREGQVSRPQILTTLFSLQ